MSETRTTENFQRIAGGTLEMQIQHTPAIRRGRFIGLLMCCVVLLATGQMETAQAQSMPIIYPSQGQSVQQQTEDESQCRSWAQQQTGFNPLQGAPTVSTTQSGGQVVRGAAGGALLGAVGGAIGGSASSGAAIGAGVGATAGLLRRGSQNASQQQAQQQATAQYNEKLALYNRTFATCMQGRGYAVN